MDYELIEETPTPQEFVTLRQAAGMSDRTIEAAKAGLGSECVAVSIRDGDDLVGMGRVVGDGATVFQVVDIAVDPGQQGHGLGRRIMEHLVAWIDVNAPPSAYVNLIASEPEFYELFGFESCAPTLVGMDRAVTESVQTPPAE